MRNRFLGTITFIFLMVVAIVGMLAFVMQNAFGDITFVEFFQMVQNGELSKK